MFHLVLVHPEIPPNTGNIIRLAANTGCQLHLIEPLGFSMDDKLLKRAGLDYHEYAAVQRHASWLGFVEHWQRQQATRPVAGRLWAMSTKGTQTLSTMHWQPGDGMVFGAESTGLPPDIRESAVMAGSVRLPLRPGQRSLNLSNAAAVTVFDAWRQCGYEGAGA